MTHRRDQVLKAALALPPAERARLAHELVRSLDAGEGDTGAQTTWTGDIERRLRDVREGTAALIDLDDVDAYVAQKLAEAHR